MCAPEFFIPDDPLPVTHGDAEVGHTMSVTWDEHGLVTQIEFHDADPPCYTSALGVTIHGPGCPHL